MHISTSNIDVREGLGPGRFGKVHRAFVRRRPKVTECVVRVYETPSADKEMSSKILREIKVFYVLNERICRSVVFHFPILKR
jgi:hypothetical protein